MATKDEANKLFDQLRAGLLATQVALEEIIRTKAWEQLGYDTFQEAWEDRLSDIELTGVMRATVVLAMFSQGATETEVATTVSGVGPARAKAYKQAHQAKLPAKKAELHAEKMVPVRSFTRSLPKKRNSLIVDGFTDEEIDQWSDLARHLNVDRNELLREALREGMKGWEGANAVA